MRFAPDQLVGFRRGIMRRGLDLATILSELLGGKDKTSTLAAMQVLKPGLKPEEALRMALDQVEGRRKLIDTDDDRYGRCDVCGDDLGPLALGELPWADRCQKHLRD